MSRSEGERFARFLLAGGIAAAGNYGSRFLFSDWFTYVPAIVLAYCVGMCIAFVLMRTYVFDATQKALGPQAVRFTIVNLFAVGQTLVVSLILAEWILPQTLATHQREAIAHAVGVAIPVITSYVGHRVATFR